MQEPTATRSRVDADGDTWVWCDCPDNRIAARYGDSRGPGWAYAPDGVTPFDGHRHVDMRDVDWLDEAVQS